MKFIAGLRVWGNWKIGENVLKVFLRLRGSANRRVDLFLPLIASILCPRPGAGEVASGEWRENSSQSLAGIDGCRNSAFLILFYTFYGPSVQAMDTQLGAAYVRIGHVQPTAADSRVADHRSFPQPRSGLRSSRNWRACPDPRRAQYKGKPL